jgi:trk system potassium uptake protein TrkH
MIRMRRAYAAPVMRGATRAVSGLGVDVIGALNLVGALVKYLGLAFLFPAAVAAGYGEAVWPFLLAGALTAAFGVALERGTAGKESVGAREGYLVVSLVWLLVAIFGAIPYLAAEPQLSHPVDAFFESMSGFSTTGSSVVADIDALTPSMAMWRQFTQWIGGVGIIVMFLAVLPRLRVGGRQALFNSEMPGPELPLATTIREAARRFVTLYVAITAIETLVLAALGWTGVDPRMTFFNATAHSFATVSTAGFSPESRSMEPFAPATQWVTVVFMLVAGTNFALLFAGVAGWRPRLIARDEEVRVGVVLLACAAAVVVIGLVSAEVLTGEAAVRHGVFNTVSMMTTTGFASADFNEWSALPVLVLFGVVMIGTSAGSTSGSIKLIRHITIAKMLRREIDQTLHPEVVAPLRVNGAIVDERALRAIIVFVFLYVGVCVGGAVVLLFDSSLRDIDVTAFHSLTAAATTLGGAGPSLGFAGPMGSFDPFSDVSKLVLTGLMYLGRLEIVPVLVLFTASHWRA